MPQDAQLPPELRAASRRMARSIQNTTGMLFGAAAVTLIFCVTQLDPSIRLAVGLAAMAPVLWVFSGVYAGWLLREFGRSDPDRS